MRNKQQLMMIKNKAQSKAMLALLGCFLMAILARAQTNTIPLPSVNPGSQAQAESYYIQLSKDLNFLTPNTITNSKLDDVLRYLGYNGLHAVDLDNLPSDVLMDYDLLKTNVSDPAGFTAQFHNTNDLPNGSILVSRFFAPKITDDSHLPPNAYGWRKLIRLVAHQNLTASNAVGMPIVSAFILYNYFQADLNKSPFDPSNKAVNIQVALVSTRDSINSRHAPIYWLDYDPTYKIHFELDAFFDARDPILPKKQYFVPDACVSCHNNKNKPLLNYLDTDYWIDRAQSVDFSTFSASKWPVLFDAGTRDDSTPQFGTAFETIRQLNTEIADQNSSTSPKIFMTAASKNWLTLHINSVTHVQPIDRAIPTPPATQTWIKGNPDDEKILPLLSQYCFRCHGSVSFNVFDKGAVLGNTLKMKDRIEWDFNANPADRRVAMPPDREIPASDKAAILDFLYKSLQQN
jgi:hypothetical protein